MFNNLKYKYIFGSLLLGCATSLNVHSLKGNHHTAQAQNKPTIVASHNILCDLIETIAEDTVDLSCLLDANQDPHTYRPTPSQRRVMEEAQLILYGGYQLEPQIIQLIEATETPASKIAVYEQVVAEPILSQPHDHSEEEHSEEEHSKEEHSEEEHDHSEEEHDHSEEKAELEPDPHVWHNVENTVAAIELMQPLLLQLNPSAAPQYLQNSTTLTEKLWQLDAWIDEQIATIPEGKRILVTTHKSLSYYAQAYGLDDYHTLQGLSSESSPTASDVKSLTEEIQETGVPIIFVESTQGDRVMNNVARAANVKLSSERLYTDSLGEADSYIEMMSHNTCAIVDGLGGECQAFGE